MEALLAEQKKLEALIDTHRKAMNDAHYRVVAIKAEITKLKAEEAEKAKAEEEAKAKEREREETKKRNEAYKAAKAKEEAEEKAKAEAKTKAEAEKLEKQGRIRYFFGILEDYNYVDGLDDGQYPHVQGILSELKEKLGKTSSYPKEVKVEKKPYFYFYGGNGSAGGSELDILREAYGRTSHSWKMETQEDDVDLSSVKKQKNFLRKFDNGDNMIESYFDDEDNEFNPMESGFITYFLTVASKEQEDDFTFWKMDMDTAEETTQDNKEISKDTPLTHKPTATPKKAEAPISIPKKEFVAEHKELVQVLKKDEPKAVAKELKKQEAELKAVGNPLDKYTNSQIKDIIREHLKKHGKTVALSALNKTQLYALHKEVMAKYK